PAVRSLAALAAPFVFPLAVQLTLTWPDGGYRGRADRLLVRFVYVEAAAAAVVLAMFRDPLADVGCWSDCTDNVFLLPSFPGLARTVVAADRWFLVAATVPVAAAVIRRLADGSASGRRALLPVVVPGLALAGALAAHGVAASAVRVEDPTAPAFV